MASIDENLRTWDSEDQWGQAGEQWSSAWGSSHAMWHGSILPRIAPFLPADHVLEIACGHGRVTAFLLDQCRRYTGVDLVPRCVEFCQRRFAARDHAAFHRSDGRSLDMVEDAAVDFAFSWDSLVHVDAGVFADYLVALAQKLRPGGSAFLHHSNLKALIEAAQGGEVENAHWRDSSSSAAVVRESCDAAGLACRSQELVQWGSRLYTDCFTVGQTRAQPAGSHWLGSGPLYPGLV